MKSIQKNIFLETEGDSYYNRNKRVLNDHGNDSIIDYVSSFLNYNNKVLEIGCANGNNLSKIESLNPKLDLNLYGLDPSELAITEGMKKNSNLKLFVGTGDDINFESSYFDIVVCGFFLYLVDRELIFKTIAEIDRVLNYGGLIIIIDFDVPFPRKNQYKHLDNIFSYKQDYSKFFTGGKHYTLIGKKHYHPSDKISFHKEIDKRRSCSILYKELINDIY